MRRVVFDTGEHSYVRVRDEGGRIVMTYKDFLDQNSITGTKENNVGVDKNDDAIEILECCGLHRKSHEESLREKWKIGEVEVCIDAWPWLPTYVEVEGPDEVSVWDIASKLGLDKDSAMFGSVDNVYAHYYGIDPKVFTYETPEVTFDMEPPVWVRSSRA